MSEDRKPEMRKIAIHPLLRLGREESMTVFSHVSPFRTFFDIDTVPLPRGIADFSFIAGKMHDELRLASSQLWVGHAGIEPRWESLRESGSLMKHLESKIQTSLAEVWQSKGASLVPVSEEIATFAVEIMENRGVQVQDVISRLKKEAEINVFCDILRLARKCEVFAKEATFIRRYVCDQKENRLLRLALSAASAKTPQHIDMEFVLSARGALEQEGWSYFLFELAASGTSNATLFRTLLELKDLRCLDQLICIFGLRGTLSEENAEGLVAARVAELFRQEDTKVIELAIELCQSLPGGSRERILLRAFAELKKRQERERILAHLAMGMSDDTWQKFRVLAATEKDPEIRAALKKAEQFLLDERSRKANRARCDRISGPRGLREALWKRMKR